MRLIQLIYLSLGLIANAAVIHSRGSNTTKVETRDAATGYRSVAYFVNWVGGHSQLICMKRSEQQL